MPGLVSRLFFHLSDRIVMEGMVDSLKRKFIEVITTKLGCNIQSREKAAVTFQHYMWSSGACVVY